MMVFSEKCQLIQFGRNTRNCSRKRIHRGFWAGSQNSNRLLAGTPTEVLHANSPAALH